MKNNYKNKIKYIFQIIITETKLNTKIKLNIFFKNY